MEMDSLPNLVPIAPIAAVGQNRRDELNRHLQLSRNEKLVLVSMGGISGRLPIDNWPHIDGVRWLVQENWQVKHPDVIALESLPLSFSDLLASSDALLCKPGYGSFAEAACCAIPVLFVSRADWPESPALAEWLQQHNVCREITQEQLQNGNLEQALAELWSSTPISPPQPNGAVQAADYLMHLLALSGN
jgi:hypothetical protein